MKLFKTFFIHIFEFSLNNFQSSRTEIRSITEPPNSVDFPKIGETTTEIIPAAKSIDVNPSNSFQFIIVWLVLRAYLIILTITKL